MAQYRDAGLDMMHEAACFEDGGNSVEAGVQEMHDRMRGGRWKVFRGRNDEWLEEYSMYHRKDGLLVKEGDDAISASRYALMHRRFGHAPATTPLLWMRMPGGASTGLKCHIAATDKCRIGRLKQRVKAHCAGEIVRRSA